MPPSQNGVLPAFTPPQYFLIKRVLVKSLKMIDIVRFAN